MRHHRRSHQLKERTARERRLMLELLEERNLLSADPLQIYTSAPPPKREIGENQALLGGGAGIVAPFPLEQTFALHSLPGATKRIYLDFDGHLTRETQWNADFNLPNILTFSFSLDDDYVNFSDEERLYIQLVWERVAEDFRPFQVDVTTEDPGVDALRNTGGDDQEWGQRVVIGGSTHDWYTPVDGAEVGGVSYGSFPWDTDTPNFAFAADFDTPENVAEVISHETGHSLGLAHDSQFRFYRDVGEDPPEIVRLFVTYYAGHGADQTAWAPIMGVGYGKYLTQWSKGEYFNATNDAAGQNPLQDDLEIITNRGGNNGNGFGYRVDDHGNTTATASTVVQDPATAGLETSLFMGEGIIERNTDIDFFSFVVEGLGELVSLDIQPFHNGPNLDVLAKVYGASGNLIATSDSINDLGATFTDLQLLPGTYYVSVQGAGRPITFIDPLFHPGPFEAEGNPPDPALPEDLSDWGYSNYGSLGQFSILGTRKKGLVVGVDFDASSGLSPQNWTKFTGGGQQTTLNNLVNETGLATPYDLTIRTSGTGFQGQASGPISNGQVPNHALPLTNLAGYISTTTDLWTFEWSGLQASTVYQIFVFGHASTAVQNHVTIVGGVWNGVTQTYNFTQSVSANGMVVNDNAPGSDALATLSLFVIADPTGKITINVSAEAGATAGLAGLAIAPTKVGSLQGQKWNDLDGDTIKDPGEGGLANWTIFLDLNDDGILNSTSDSEIVQPSPDVPQPLLDNATKKSELVFTEVGQIIDIDVKLSINHTFNADLNVYLISPAGTIVKLFSDIGGNSDNFTNTIFDDEAPLPITSGVAPYTGRFRPEANITASELAQYPGAHTVLSAFDGENASGTWRLEVQDDANGDTGTLLSWSITVKLLGVFLEPFFVTNASGNYAFDNLPPGLYHVREHFQEAQTLAGWKATWTPPPVTVRSGAQVTGIDFGNRIPVSLPGSISGNVWNDLNGNGTKDPGELGLPGWVIYVDSDNDGVLDSNSTLSIPSTDVPKPITDFSNVQSRVAYNGLGRVVKVAVTLDIAHSFVGDLDVFLVSPSGTSVELFTNVGGQFNDLHNLTLDDSASRSIGTIGFNDLPYTGTWRPEGLLSDFIGEDATGNWTLVVRDTTFADTGTLNNWWLTITVGELITETDQNGNYTFANLPPGTYLIREQQQPGWQQTFPTGNNGWQVSIGGGNATDRNFGNRQLQMLLGDYDRNGLVDNGDYIVWRKTMGSSVPAFSGADGSGNGVVDQNDFSIWRTNYGRSLPASGGTVAFASLIADEPQPALSAAAAVEPAAVATIAAQAAVADVEEFSQPVSESIERSTGSSATRQAAATPLVDEGSIRLSTPAKGRVASSDRVRNSAAGDAALLAWLATGTHRARLATAVGLETTYRDESTGTTLAELCDSVDSVFEAIGGNRSRRSA